MSREAEELMHRLLRQVRAGKSLDRALSGVAEEISVSEFKLIGPSFITCSKRLQLGDSAEEVLSDFAARTGVRELLLLARSIEVAKRTDGNVGGVLEYTISVLEERRETETEIRALLHKKRFERRLMMVIPLGIFGLMFLVAPDYLAPLWQTVPGRLAALGALALMGLGSFFASRLFDISA